MKYENKLYKFFVISDVHGEYEDMIAALNEAGFDRSNNSHVLVTLGDMFDRGPKSNDIWCYLDSIKRNERANKAHIISIKGNHDVMLQEYLEKGMNGEFVLFNILHNGLADTIESFGQLKRNSLSINELEMIKDNIKSYFAPKLLNWLQELPLYFETRNAIFVHAGVNPKCGLEWKQTDPDYMLWDIQDSAKLIPGLYKTVIFGHHHAFRVKSMCLEDKNIQVRSIGGDTIDVRYSTTGDRIRFSGYGNTDDNGIIAIYKNGANGIKFAIDGCTNLTHKVNVLVFEDYFTEDDILHTEVKEEKNEYPEGSTIHLKANGDYVSVSSTLNADMNAYTTNIPEPHWYYTNANEAVATEGWTAVNTHTFPF